MNDFLERHKNYLKYLLLLSLISFVILFVGEAADAAWYNTNWQYRKKITIQSSQVSGGPHSNFPVLISRTDTDLRDDARDDGYDILFTASDEVSKIPHEIEKFNGTTGELVAWVKVGSVSSASNTDIYMYYGYASATNQQDAANVWDSNYRGVWHLKESGNGTVDEFLDSSGPNHGRGGGGTSYLVPSQDTGGKIGNAQLFDGSNDYIRVEDDASLHISNYLTVEAWVYPNTDYVWQTIVSKMYTQTEHLYFVLDDSSTSIYLGLNGVRTDWDTGRNVATGGWHYVAFTYDGSIIRVYRDDVQVTSSTNSGTLTLGSNTQPLYIGFNEGWTNEVWHGKMDEVRISSVARSADWIATCYSNQNAPGNFVVVDVETSGGGGNNPPVVDAGSEQNITLPASASLDGTATDGGDGPTTPPDVQWTKQSGPGTVTFGNQYAQDTTASFSTDGTYILRLTADDGADTAYDEVTITVYPAGGGPPIGDYSCNMKITIQGSQVQGGPHDDFPVLISITDESLKTSGCGFVTSDDGYDILFTNSSKSSQLAHEIEKYDKDAGELIAWVKVDLNASPSNTEIYMYYGKSGAGDQQNPTAVWDSNYVAVLHLQDQNNLEDSTSYNNDGTPHYINDDTGKISGGQYFDGGSDYISVQDATSLDLTTELTMEAWVKLTSAGTNQKVVGKVNSTYTRGYLIGVQTGLYPEIWNSQGTNHVFTSGSISSSQWVHLATTWKTGGNMIGYINGSQVNSISAGSYNIGTNDDDLIIGAAPWNPDTFEVSGIIDEIRISSAARSADWIKTEYNNQNDPSSFYSVEKNCPSTTPPISEFSCSVPITIDSSKVSGTSNLINFPVLISLTDTGLKTAANCGHVQNSNGYDIIFSDSTQTIQLDHEIEKYNGATGELVAWVRIPTLYATADTTIYLHFGHSSTCGPTENPTGVWDSNYKGVWHLNNGDSTESGFYTDSSGNNQHGTLTDTDGDSQVADGKIGGAFDFAGDNDDDFIAMADFSQHLNTAMTISGWVKPASSAPTSYDGFFGVRGDTENDFYILQLLGTTNLECRFRNSDGLSWNANVSSALSGGSWSYVALTYDGDTLISYVDGQSKTTNPAATGSFSSTALPFRIGGTGAHELDGTVDEVRASNTTRSADWIKTSYNNQSDPSSFYSVGASSCFFLTGFSCNRKITIDSSKVESTSDLANFPVLIKIDNDCNIKTAAYGGSIQNSSGWDIIFTDSDGVTQLDHEIEEYDGDSGDLTAWVKIPTLPYNSDKDIYMYYGKSGLACDPSNPAGVWSNSYRGVWHLHDTSGNTQDSTSYNTDGTLSGTVTRGANGEIDNAFDFGYRGEVDWGDPGDGHLDFGTGSMTLSLWVNMDNHRGAWEQIIIKGKDYRQPGYQIEVDDSSNTFYFSINENDGDYDWGRTASISFDLDTWIYIVGVVDRSNNRIRGYKDGVQVDSSDISLIGSISTWDSLTIGRDDWGYPDARIEEVRIANTARSAGWIKTEFNNQNDPSTFYSMSQDTCGGSYGFNYQYCKKITVDRTQVVQASNVNFPLLINLQNYDDLKTEANGGRVGNNNGWDIVFKDKNCLTLDHEIDYYDGATGTLVAWVRIPDLTNTEDYEVYMYYGDSNVICSPENPDGLWDPSIYEAVYHLSDDYKDSTSNDHDGSNYGTSFTASQIGRGALFTPSNGWDHIELGTWSVGGDDMTIQAWVWPNDFNQGDPRVVTKCSTTGSGVQDHVFMLSLYNGDNGENRMRFRVKTGTDNSLNTTELFGTSPNGYLPTAQTWHFLAATYEDDRDPEMRMYRDEGLDAGTMNHTLGGDHRINSWPVWIGASPYGTSNSEYSWDGVLDEVRILSRDQSQDWLETEYRNQSDPGNFYTVGSCFEQTTEVTQEWVEEVQ